MVTLNNVSWLKSATIQKIFSILEEVGAETRIVGGAVRNSILGLDIKDIDFATTALPDEVINSFTANEIRTVPTGIEFGTVTVVLDSQNYEITTLREDIQTDGRHAVVKFGKDWIKDAERRDFTMNALYLDRNGNLFDCTGGYQDCLEKKIRFIGSAEQRIEEDYLRILRYFRFMATFGTCEFDKATMSAILRRRNGLSQLSPERVSMELLRIFPTADADKIITTLVETGIFQMLTGGVARLNRFQRLIDLSKKFEVEIKPALLLYSLSVFESEDIDRVAEKIQFLYSERKKLHCIHELTKEKILKLTKQTLTKLLYEYGRQTAREGVLVKFIDGQLQFEESKLESILRKLDELEIPEFEISGNDLIAIGVKPGVKMGEMLRSSELEWIESGFKLNKKELMQKIKRFL